MSEHLRSTTGHTDAGDEPVMTQRQVGDWWATSIADIAPGRIHLSGYPIEELIPQASFPQVIWLMLRGELPSPAQARLLERALVAAVDHGPQAPSIAAARMAATSGVGLNNAVATGVNLLGDVHGGAGQQCMQLLEAIRHELDDPGADLERVVSEHLAALRAARQMVPGFGHRFHPRDPRRDPLLHAVAAAVDDGFVDGGFLRIAIEMERQLAVGRARPVPMNIDGATAVVYSELGFPAELGRGLFVLSRSVGILAHAWEQTQEGARIKGPLPRQVLPTYTGPGTRHVPSEHDGRPRLP